MLGCGILFQNKAKKEEIIKIEWNEVNNKKVEKVSWFNTYGFLLRKSNIRLYQSRLEVLLNIAQNETIKNTFLYSTTEWRTS